MKQRGSEWKGKCEESQSTLIITILGFNREPASAIHASSFQVNSHILII